jgi:Schlafen, AlbA_2
MVALRSRRLQAIFGVPLDDLQYEHLEALVPNQVSEAFDLDFKGSLYGNADKDRRDLATDVAALANTAGGLLVLGIAEDRQARAVAAPGVAVSDAEIRRILQIVGSLVVPLPVLSPCPS